MKASKRNPGSRKMALAGPSPWSCNTSPSANGTLTSTARISAAATEALQVDLMLSLLIAFMPCRNPRLHQGSSLCEAEGGCQPDSVGMPTLYHRAGILVECCTLGVPGHEKLPDPSYIRPWQR